MCIAKKHNPAGLVNVHQSTYMGIPTLAWATSYWDGEQFTSQEGLFVQEVLPLGAFRSEFMGHQWGIPAEFYVMIGLLLMRKHQLFPYFTMFLSVLVA